MADVNELFKTMNLLKNQVDFNQKWFLEWSKVLDDKKNEYMAYRASQSAMTDEKLKEILGSWGMAHVFNVNDYCKVMIARSKLRFPNTGFYHTTNED